MQKIAGLPVRREGAQATDSLARQFLPHLLVSAPLLVAVPIIFALLFNVSGRGRISLLPFGVGALGWLLALLLRTPLYLFTLRPDKSSTETLLAALSGPCEEFVRLLAVLLLHRDFPTAFSLGLGWAAVEILYTVLQGLATVLVLSKGGAQALQLKMRFLDTGQTVEATVYWGLIERVSATALHTGFTLLLAYQPLLILATLPLHSAINVSAVKLIRRSMVSAQLTVFALGAAVLLVGIALFE